MTAAVDDTVPTVFVIVPAPKKPSEAEELMRDAEKARAAIESGETLEATKTTFRVAKRMVASATKLYNSVSETVSDPYGKAEKVMKEILEANEFHMYLVCELCYRNQPEDDDNGGAGKPWPVKITSPSDQTVQVATKILPLARLFVQGANTFNGLVNMGRVRYFAITVPTFFECRRLERASSLSLVFYVIVELP